MDREYKRARALLLAWSISCGGDVLFAFLWSAGFIPHAPSASLLYLGAGGAAGVVLGSLFHRRLQGSERAGSWLWWACAVRAACTALLLPVLHFAPERASAAAAVVEAADIVAGILTSGLITSMAAKAVAKDQFARLMGEKQLFHKGILLGSTLLAGFVLSVGPSALIALDVLTFLPILLVLRSWPVAMVAAEHAESQKEEKSLLVFFAVVFLIYFASALTSRTSPLLWKELSGAGGSPVQYSLFFTLFLVGQLASGALASGGWLRIQYGARSLAAFLALAAACQIGMAYAGHSFPLFSFSLGLTGLFFGLYGVSMLCFIRERFEGPRLDAAFRIHEVMAYLIAPTADVFSGLFLARLAVSQLYVLASFGLVAPLLLFPLLNRLRLAWRSS